MIRLAVRVTREQSETVLAELLELAPAGVEELAVGEHTIEYAVYGAPGELPGLPDLNALAGDALVQISTSEVPDDWQERWKRFHLPVLIEPPCPSAERAHGLPALHVRPPWEAPSSVRETPVAEIVIDPGQAFGTGAHATTRLCLELLLELAASTSARGQLLDIGTGSGVLAIAASIVGFEPVLALDNERESVAAARANAHVNHVPIEVCQLDLRAQPLPWAPQPRDPAGGLVVTANLLRPLLLELAARMPSCPAHLIAGGLLEREADEVARAFARRLQMCERRRRSSGEWVALWLSAT